MKKHMTITALALAFSVAATAAVTAKILTINGGAKFVVSKTEHGYAYSATETRFFHHTLSYDNQWKQKDQLFKVTSRQISQTGLDGVDDQSVIESYTTDKSPFDTKGWTLKVNGGHFKFHGDDFVQVTSYGCCDSPNFNRLINMKSGKVIATALNESTFSLEVPNSKLARRYLAVLDDTKAPRKSGDKSYIGTIGYFSAERVLGMVRVYVKLEPGWGASFDELKPVLKEKDQVRDHSITLWSADFATDAKTAYSEIGVSTQIYYSSRHADVKIMLQGDELSASKSQATSDAELVLVK